MRRLALSLTLSRVWCSASFSHTHMAARFEEEVEAEWGLPSRDDGDRIVKLNVGGCVRDGLLLRQRYWLASCPPAHTNLVCCHVDTSCSKCQLQCFAKTGSRCWPRWPPNSAAFSQMSKVSSSLTETGTASHHLAMYRQHCTQLF